MSRSIPLAALAAATGEFPLHRQAAGQRADGRAVQGQAVEPFFAGLAVE